jgi:hypothetical protein
MVIASIPKTALPKVLTNTAIKFIRSVSYIIYLSDKTIGAVAYALFIQADGIARTLLFVKALAVIIDERSGCSGAYNTINAIGTG